MADHFCSTCGVACSGPAAPVVVEEGGDGAGETVERALETVDHALDVLETVIVEEEQTERVEAIADAEVDIVEAEADATVDVVEALTEEPVVVEEENDAELGDDDVVGDADEPAEGEPGGEEEEGEEGDGTAQAIPVEVPPQLEEEANNPGKPQGRTTSAFRRRRMHHR